MSAFGTDLVLDCILSFLGWGFTDLRSTSTFFRARLPKPVAYEEVLFESSALFRASKLQVSVSTDAKEAPETRSYRDPPSLPPRLPAFLMALHDLTLEAFLHLYSLQPSLTEISIPWCLSLSLGRLFVTSLETPESFTCFSTVPLPSGVEAPIPPEFASKGLGGLEFCIHHSDAFFAKCAYRFLSVKLTENERHYSVALAQKQDGSVRIMDNHGTLGGWAVIAPWLQRLFFGSAEPCRMLMSATVACRSELRPLINAQAPLRFAFRKSTSWIVYQCVGAHVKVQARP
jgi:hypothetical protein